MSKLSVAILGASDKEGRYSKLSQELLMERGYEVFPVTPSRNEVLGVKAFSSLKDLPSSIHTLTVYVKGERVSGMEEDILRLKPERIIFNPGSENHDSMLRFKAKGIEVLEACTLVMLRMNQFE